MKKLISFLLALCLAVACFPGAFAGISNSRVIIGADLTEEQIDEVYALFNIQKGMVPQLIMTNEVERQYLEGTVDASAIGTRSVSCVYIELLDPGSGLTIETHNISLFTPEMYKSSLETAGITDARIVVAAPFEVSGTAALAGVYWAYESMAGEKLGDQQKQASAQELTVTGELAQDVGSDAAQELIGDIKDVIITAGETMTEETVSREISSIASQYGISLSEDQVDKILSMVDSVKKIDREELLETVNGVKDTIEKVSEYKDKASNLIQKIRNYIEKIKNFVQKIKDFLQKE